jgi:predicted MFS family arabinose efflux permease
MGCFGPGSPGSASYWSPGHSGCCSRRCSPLLVARFGRRRTVRGALLVAGLLIVTLGLPMVMPTMLIAAFALSTAGQMVKLSLDATVQGDVGDEARGRVFALYDAVFNIGYVLAVALAATVVPADGHAPELLLLAAAAYLTAAALYGLIDRTPVPPHSAGTAGGSEPLSPLNAGSSLRAASWCQGVQRYSRTSVGLGCG